MIRQKALFFAYLTLVAPCAYAQSNGDRIDGEIITKHSFNFRDSILGDVRFIPTEALRESPPQVHFYLKSKEGKLTKLEDPQYGWAFFSLEGVLFSDLNGDGLIDIVMVGKFATGIGPTGAVPFDVPIIYLRSKNGFHCLTDVSIKISAQARGDLNLEKVRTLYSSMGKQNRK